MKIALLPIDNRPVCYALPMLISRIDKDIELLMPDCSLLGDLTKYADIEGIFNWFESLEDVDAFVISLDTIAYGGLISSRRSPETYEEILARIERLKRVLSGKKVYAFSSIMRISNNNINEEEKPYWDKWGEKIFEFSQNFHKMALNIPVGVNPEIPIEILTDYLETRKRNFEINKIYLEWQKEGIFDTLIFSKDDCSQFGINVMEAVELERLGATVKTGADEIPLTLLARAVGGSFKIVPRFLEEDEKNVISNYEDISIETCVKNQIELAGCEVSAEDSANLVLLVNNFRNKQGEIVMRIATEPFGGEIGLPEKLFAIADVRFANGADNVFIDKFFEKGFDENFIGYSAWNTSANSLGSLLFAIKSVLNAYSKGTFDKNAFNELMLTRFLDDWAYQANVRQSLIIPNEKQLKSGMRLYENFLRTKFYTEKKIDYKFPWNRLFEVEIELI